MREIDANEAERHKAKMEKRKAVQDAEVRDKTVEKGLLIVNTGPGKGKSTAAFGLMGGPMQPQGHIQLARMLLRGDAPQTACDAPRWFVAGGNRVLVEEGFDATGLVERGHDVEVADALQFGGAQVVMPTVDGAYVGGSDKRKDGCVLSAEL